MKYISFCFMVFMIALSAGLNSCTHQTGNKNESSVSDAFEKRFPLKNLNYFNSDSLAKISDSFPFLVDSADAKRLFPNVKDMEGFNASEAGDIHYISSQGGNDFYKGYTFSAPLNNGYQIFWVNYDSNMQVSGYKIIAFFDGDEGVSYNETSRLINDSIFVKTSVDIDASDVMEEKPYYTEHKDSTIEKFLITKKGAFKTIYSHKYSSVSKIKNNIRIDNPSDTTR